MYLSKTRNELVISMRPSKEVVIDGGAFLLVFFFFGWEGNFNGLFTLDSKQAYVRIQTNPNERASAVMATQVYTNLSVANYDIVIMECQQPFNFK